jgi:hypothetical protein
MKKMTGIAAIVAGATIAISTALSGCYMEPIVFHSQRRYAHVENKGIPQTSEKVIYTVPEVNTPRHAKYCYGDSRGRYICECTPETVDKKGCTYIVDRH